MSLLEKHNLPPETGASRNVAPLLWVSSPISWATAGSIVLVSINNDPGLTVLKENNLRWQELQKYKLKVTTKT